jgi:Lsr2
MAQNGRVIITDDLDGASGAHTVAFSFDGCTYEIDLSLVPRQRGHEHDRRLEGWPDDASGPHLAVPSPELADPAVRVPAEMEEARAAIDDLEPYVPASFDDIVLAYDLGQLTKLASILASRHRREELVSTPLVCHARTGTTAY